MVPEPASQNNAVFIDSELDDFLQYAVGFGVYPKAVVAEEIRISLFPSLFDATLSQWSLAALYCDARTQFRYGEYRRYLCKIDQIVHQFLVTGFRII